MKDKKRRIGLIIGAVVLAVVLAILLALLLCRNSSPDPSQTSSTGDPAGTTNTVTTGGDTTVATEDTTVPEETTVPVEETTAPVEETTAPIEETMAPTTAPTTGGNSTPGGTSGYDPGSYTPGGTGSGDDDEEQEQEEPFVASEPGAVDNPFTESILALPDAFTSVSIPAGGTVAYEVYDAAELVLTVEDADAYIIYNGVTYEADENGIVTVELVPAEAETTAPESEGEATDSEEIAPVLFQIGNKNAAEKAFALNFTEPLGGATNPEIVESLEMLQVELEAGDDTGYHYQWTAGEDTLVTLNIGSIVPEEVQAEVVVTIGEKVIKLSENGAEDDEGNRFLAFEVVTDDVVLIQVITVPDDKEEYPAAQIELSGVLGYPEGSEKNPFIITLEAVPAQIVTGDISAGEAAEVWYEVYGAGGTILTVEAPDAYLIYNEVTYTADESGVISVELDAAAGRVPVMFRIGSTGEAAKSYTLRFAYPEGGSMTPTVIEDISEIKAVIGADNSDGTAYYSWTASGTGILQIAVSGTTEGISYDVAVNNVDLGSYRNLSSDGVNNEMGTYVQNFVREGDEVQIVVSVSNAAAYPDAEVNLAGYVLGTEESPLFVTDTEFAIPVAGGYEVYLNAYCYEQTLTIESDTAYVIFDGTQYSPVDGKITITFPASAAGMGRPTPLAFTIGNSSEYVQVYSVSIAAPLGTMENPEVITDFSSVTVNIPEGDTDGSYYYSWEAAQTGILHLSVLSFTEDVGYDVAIYNPNTGAYMNLSSDGVNNEMGTYVRSYVQSGDVVEIIISVEGVLDSNNVMHYPAAEGTLSGYVVGTEESPMFISEGEITVPIAGGSEVYVMGYCYGQTLTIESEKAYVIYNEAEYTPVDGVISITFPENTATMGRPEPITFRIGNAGEYAAKFTAVLESPVGVRENPEEIEQLGEIEASLEAGNSEGYYFKWVAAEDGVLTFQISQITEDVVGDIILTNNTTSAQRSLSSEEGATTVSIEVTKGDEILIQLATVPDEVNWSYPAADIKAQGTFTAAE